MIVWDLNPVLVSLGPLEIRWYGLVYALGFYLAYYVLIKTKTLVKREAEEYIFLLVMGSIIASRLFYVLVYNPSYYIHNLLQIPAVWQGGLSIHGGIIGGILVTVYWCKKNGKSFYDLMDTLTLPLTLALVYGRIANYVNGELPGTHTTVPWCVSFPGVEGCRHPSQLYEAGYSLVLFVILFGLHAKKYARGVLFWTFITLYGLFRFSVTFYRLPDPTDPVFLGLALGQWLSLAMFIVGGTWIARHSFGSRA